MAVDTREAAAEDYTFRIATTEWHNRKIGPITPNTTKSVTVNSFSAKIVTGSGSWPFPAHLEITSPHNATIRMGGYISIPSSKKVVINPTGYGSNPDLMGGHFRLDFENAVGKPVDVAFFLYRPSDGESGGGGESSSGKTWFVRKSGNDSNSGTSPSDAFKSVKKAVAKAKAGHTVYIGAGTYTENTYWGNRGTSDKPIKFIGDTTGVHTGDAGIVKLTGIVSVEESFIQFHNLTIRSLGHIWHEKQIGGLLKSCTLRGRVNGVSIDDNTTVTIEDCTIDGPSGSGVLVQRSSRAIVRNTSIRNCAGNGVKVVWSSRAKIDGCIIEDCGKAGLTTFTTPIPSISQVQVRTTSFQNNGNAGIRVSSARVIADSCLLIGNKHGIFVDGRRPSSGITGCVAVRCTAAGNKLDGFRCDTTFDADQLAMHHFDSIAYGNGRYGFSRKAANATYKRTMAYGNLEDNYFGIPATAGTKEEDPRFVGSTDFRLRLGSPAIDKGFLSTGYAFWGHTYELSSTDLAGNIRIQGDKCDLGCFEGGVDGARTYYVRTDGDDDADGLSSATAFRSISRAAAVVAPGDEVFIGGGRYTENVQLKRGGTTDDLITFHADTTGTKTGKGGDVVITSATPSEPAWELIDSPFVTLKGIHFSEGKRGIVDHGNVGVVIEDCQFDKHTFCSLELATDRIVVRDCEFHDNETDAIVLQELSTTIEDCTFLRNRHAVRHNASDVDQTLVLKNCKISAGRSGVTSIGALVLDDCRIEGNTGWAISSGTGIIEVRNQAKQISSNYGGLHVWSDDPTAERNLQGWNLSANNVGLKLRGGKYELKNCAIEHNTEWALNVTTADVKFVNTSLDGNENGVFFQGIPYASDATEYVIDGLQIDGVNYGLQSMGSKLRVKGLVDSKLQDGGVTAWLSELAFHDTAIDNNAGGLLLNGMQSGDYDRPMTVTGAVIQRTTGHAVRAMYGDVAVRSLTIQGASGCGIVHTGNNLTVRSSYIEKADGDYAIQFTSVSPTGRLRVEESKVVNNRGTAILAENGDLQIDNCSISGNREWAVCSKNGNVQIENQPKELRGNGGGLFIVDDRERDTPRVIKGWTLKENSGRGLALAPGGFHVKDCTLSKNLIGFAVSELKNISFENTSITDNTLCGIQLGAGVSRLILENEADLVLRDNRTHIQADQSELVLDGVTMQRGSRGVYCLNDAAATIKNCRFVDNAYGVSVANAKDLNVSSSTFLDTAVGMYIDRANESFAVNNSTFTNCTTAMALLGGTDSTHSIEGLTISNCSIAFSMQNTNLTLDSQADAISVTGATHLLVASNGASTRLKNFDVTGDLFYYTNGSQLIENCSIRGNCTSMFAAPELTIRASRFDGPGRYTPLHNIGLNLQAGTFKIENTIVSGFSRGVNLSRDNTTALLNSTIANVDTGIQFGGNLTLHNTIVSARGSGTGVEQLFGGTYFSGPVSHSHNLVAGFSSPYAGIAAGESDLLLPPVFVDDSNGNYQLAKGSPAINSGKDLTAFGISSDILGQSRPSFAKFEIGAYEYVDESGGFRVLKWQEKR